jgi:hypothetical protein
VQLIAGIIIPAFYEELKPNLAMQMSINNFFIHGNRYSKYGGILMINSRINSFMTRFQCVLTNCALTQKRNECNKFDLTRYCGKNGDLSHGVCSLQTNHYVLHVVEFALLYQER